MQCVCQMHPVNKHQSSLLLYQQYYSKAMLRMHNQRLGLQEVAMQTAFSSYATYGSRHYTKPELRYVAVA